MELTVAHLGALGVKAGQAAAFVAPLNSVSKIFGIDASKRRLAAFLAQALHESNLFRDLVENLNYSNAERVATIFRSGFDTNRDGKISAEEIAFATRYVRNPEALANRAYANRGGNRGEASGDGWRYRGRGIFQLTFHDNYLKAEEWIGQPYTLDPDLVAKPPDACMTAGHYWSTNKLNALIDAGDFDGCTRKINPGMQGAAVRRAYFARALQVLA